MFARDTAHAERVAMDAVQARETELGHDPRDVSALKCGWDIESRDGKTGRLRLLEVKGRVEGADTVTVTRNEILHALNKPDDFFLVVVEVSGDHAAAVHYRQRPFVKEPDFGAVSVNYKLADLLGNGESADGPH